MSENEVFIFDVSSNNVETVVIQNSNKIPVFVEFMGGCSEYCFVLEETLAKLAKEFAGQFIFAKVDIDEQPELKDEFEIKNVPTLKVFDGGAPEFTLEGVIDESEIRAMLKSCNIFHESDEMREQARELHLSGNTTEAVSILTQAIQKDPSNTRVAMDMVQVFIDMGELQQAQSLFERLPATDRESELGKILLGQITFKSLAAKTEGKEALQKRIAVNGKDYDARFDLAVCLVAEYQYQQAIDQLFEIFEMQPDYEQGAAKEMIINLTNMLAPNEPELAQSFRRRLGRSVA